MLRIRDDGAKSVAVTAEGRSLRRWRSETAHAWGDQMARNAHDMLIDPRRDHMMNHTLKPFVAGVRGAAGAGMSLMSAFDLVVSGESAKYTMAYTQRA